MFCFIYPLFFFVTKSSQTFVHEVRIICILFRYLIFKVTIEKSTHKMVIIQNLTAILLS